MVEQEIKSFYDRIQFPGLYTRESMDLYSHCPENRYLAFIYQYLSNQQTVLDAGCGSGLISNLFANRFNSKFVAMDMSDSILHGQHYSQQNNIDNVTWLKQDLKNLDYQEYFDVVICQGVLHHIPDYQNVLNKLKAALTPGGVLLLGLYNPFGKLLKKFASVNYANEVLYQDQELNPFELSFSHQQVLELCNDMELLCCTPSVHRRYLVNLLALANQSNGGLTLYAFRKKI
jgi:2-polyprenyl-3-methyl-5-hydroxy-6-metoxy-1,4-benzoquinol methylase